MTGSPLPQRRLWQQFGLFPMQRLWPSASPSPTVPFAALSFLAGITQLAGACRLPCSPRGNPIPSDWSPAPAGPTCRVSHACPSASPPPTLLGAFVFSCLDQGGGCLTGPPAQGGPLLVCPPRCSQNGFCEATRTLGKLLCELGGKSQAALGLHPQHVSVLGAAVSFPGVACWHPPLLFPGGPRTPRWKAREEEG